MKTTIKQLRTLIREAWVYDNNGRRFQMDCDNEDAVFQLALREFDGVAYDLGVDDFSDPEFVEWFEGRMIDMPIPRHVREEVAKRLAQGVGRR